MGKKPLSWNKKATYLFGFKVHKTVTPRLPLQSSRLVKEKIKLLYFAKLLKEFEKVVPEGEQRRMAPFSTWKVQRWRHAFQAQSHKWFSSVTQEFPNIRRGGHPLHNHSPELPGLISDSPTPQSLPPSSASWRVSSRSIHSCFLGQLPNSSLWGWRTLPRLSRNHTYFQA